MPITLLDVILLVVMLISALLAMVRGFMREVLSIASWVTAAVVTILAYPKALPTVQGYLSNDIAAKAVTIGGIFLGTLIVVAVITIKISDMVLDSRIGALDRTLGFLFGLGRGLIVVVVAYAFFDWLVPDRSQPEWVVKAKSKIVLSSTRDWIKAQLPEDPESTILKRLKRNKPDEEPPTTPPAGRSSLVPGFRSSSYGEAGSETNFENQEGTSKYLSSSAAYRFEIPDSSFAASGGGISNRRH